MTATYDPSGSTVTTVKVESAYLRAALGHVRKCAARRGVPIISGTVRVDLEAGALVLTSTDLEVTARASILDGLRGQYHDGTHSAIVHADAIASALKGAKGEIPVSFGTAAGSDSVETLTVGASSIRSLSVEDWPRLPAHYLAESTSVSLAPYASIASIASTDNYRPILMGLHFNGSGEAAATDSYRLAIYDAAPALSGLWPARVFTLAAKASSDGHGFLTVDPEPGDKPAALEVETTTKYGGITYFARGIDGDFPNYRQLVPSDPPGRIEVDDVDALRRFLATIPKRENASVKLETGNPGTVRASWHRADVGEGSLEVPGLFGLSGDAIHFNPGFLTDFLAGADRAVIRGTDHLKPVVLVHDGETRLLMPVRVS